MGDIRAGIVVSDVRPCELFRARGPAEYLADAGEIEFVMLSDMLNVRYARRASGQREAIAITNLPDVDVIVITRGVMPARVVEIIPLIQREGIAVVVDFDDDYEHLPSTLMRLYKINPSINPNYNWAQTKIAARKADLITVSTPALRRFRSDAVVVRNCIPDSYLSIKHRGDGRTVGWGGTVYGHPGDLRVCGSGVNDAIRRAGGRFMNVGDGELIVRDLGLLDPPDITGIVTLDEYPRELARFDVGIAPLKINAYSRAKSALKMIESMSVGSCAVGSPTPEYVRLEEEARAWCESHDCPPFAAIAGPRGREWRRSVLGMLERDEESRLAASRGARDFIRERYLMSEHAYEWAEAWELAVKMRKSRGGEPVHA